MSRVRPGVLLTNANRFPVSALMALDLPVFDRPTKATSPTLAGASASEATLLKKQALRKSDIDSAQPVLLEYQPFERRLAEGKRHETSVGAFELCGLRRPARRPGAPGPSSFRQGP